MAYFMARAGITHGKLAEKIGLTRSSISQWVAGTSTPTTENLLRAIAALQLEPEVFWGVLDDAQPPVGEG